MGVSAIAHRPRAADAGLSIDQVVHDYGDLCQAITDWRGARTRHSGQEFRTLNAAWTTPLPAVTEFSSQREPRCAAEQAACSTSAWAFLVQSCATR
jgi:hypothetical protein